MHDDTVETQTPYSFPDLKILTTEYDKELIVFSILRLRCEGKIRNSTNQIMPHHTVHRDCGHEQQL